MRYTRTRDYLSRQARDMRARDMRNPYGSRGGYVTSRRGGRDYEQGTMGGSSMGADREYNSSGYDRANYGHDMAFSGRSGEYDREYRSNDGNFGYDMTYYPVRRVGSFDYNTYGGDYNYDMRGGRDYASNDYKLTPTEIRKWDKELKNEGAPFSVDQVRQVAQQHGIRFDEFTPELLTAVANMMFTDYKDTVKGDISTFVKLAKDFLCDDDFDGEPEEKAYLYYTAIVNKDDD